MIKKFNQHIKENMVIDTPIIKIAKQQGVPLDQIVRLDCYNNQLTSLEGIEKLKNLEILDCSGNQLTSLKGIENLIKLKTLHCSSNRLTSLKGIENLVNLKILQCSYNKLTNLKGIENLVNLETLGGYGNIFSNDYKEYFMNFEIKLDRLIKNNDISTFSKIYSGGTEKWKNKYYKRNPENQDIIDGINTGIF